MQMMWRLSYCTLYQWALSQISPTTESVRSLSTHTRENLPCSIFNVLSSTLIMVNQEIKSNRLYISRLLTVRYISRLLPVWLKILIINFLFINHLTKVNHVESLSLSMISNLPFCFQTFVRRSFYYVVSLISPQKFTTKESFHEVHIP